MTRTALLLLALAACGPTAHLEAGSDAPGFGEATATNAAVQARAAEGFVSDLSARFRAEVPAAVTFAFDSAALDGAAQAALDAQAAFIRAFPEARFSVTGHADLVGSSAYNRALGLRRAQAVVAYLAARGVEGSRLEALVSEGDTQPLVPTQAPERLNRRAVTDVRGLVSSHPNVLNGRYAEVIFRDYVTSAGSPATTVGIDGSEVATDQ